MSESLKTPPNDRLIQDARRDEERFLSIVYRDLASLEAAVEAGVQWTWFWNKDLGVLYAKAVQYLQDHHALLTRTTIESMLEKVCSPEETTRVVTIFNELWFIKADLNEFPFLVKQITARHAQRQVFTVVDDWHSRTLKTTNDQLKMAEEFLNATQAVVLPTHAAHKCKQENFGDILDQVAAEISDRRENPANYQGFKTGFNTIDSVFNGFQRGRSLVICAPEGGGKTSLMLTLADNMARAGHTVVYVTVESGAKDLEMRLISRHATVDFNRIMRGGKDDSGGIGNYHMKMIETAINERRQKPGDRLRYITVDYDTPWPIIAKQIDRIRAFTSVDVVVVDYLDCIGRISKHEGRYDLELKDLFQEMVNDAKRHHHLLITAQQLKSDKVRDIHKAIRGGKEIYASTGDVAGSKGIAAIADYMLLLMIERERKRIQLRTMKARMAPSGDPFILEYLPEMMLMRDPSGREVCEAAATLVTENIDQVVDLVAQASGSPPDSLPVDGDFESDPTPWGDEQ